MIESLDALEAATQALLAEDVPDTAVADVSGRVRAVEVKLGDWRRGLENHAVGLTVSSDPEEQRPAPRGVQFRLEPTVVIERTYSTPTILAAVADASGKSVTDVIRSAIEARAMKLEWSYRAMVKWVKKSGATVTTASGQVPSESDLDEPMIREFEKAGRPKRVPIGAVQTRDVVAADAVWPDEEAAGREEWEAQRDD